MQQGRSQHFGLTLLLSFVVGASGFFVDQAFRWTEVLHGLFNGIVLSFMFAFSWVLVFLPWCLVVYYVFRWRQWKRYRTHFALAPSVLLLCVTIGSLLIQPPTPQRRLRDLAGAELPPGATGLRYFFSGGGLADYSDTYSFSCSPSDTERLIAEMKLERSDSYQGGESYLPFRTLPGAPDYRGWQGAALYQRHDDDSGWFYYLLTSSDRTMVYIHTGCI